MHFNNLRSVLQNIISPNGGSSFTFLSALARSEMRYELAVSRWCSAVPILPIAIAVNVYVLYDARKWNGSTVL